MLQPKYGFLKFILDNYFNGEVHNFQFVPVTINYSRVLEGETFPMELLGEEKVKESLGRVLNAVKIMRMNFGKIHVEFGKPIDFNTYYNTQCAEKSLDAIANKEDKKIVI